jgi:hypothetical protein
MRRNVLADYFFTRMRSSSSLSQLTRKDILFPASGCISKEVGLRSSSDWGRAKAIPTRDTT